MTRRRRRLIVLGLVLGLVAGVALAQFVERLWGRLNADPIFLAKPYIQLGDNPANAVPERLELLWLARDGDALWTVEVRRAEGQKWSRAEPPTERRIAVDGVEPHRLCRARLDGLTPGAEFAYRVGRDGRIVFEATARVRKGPGQPHRFVTFGDCAAGTPEQRAVAYQAWRARPDFVFIPGDIAYPQGSITDYVEKYFPVYNHDEPSARRGAPLLRSTLFLAVPGNHDLTFRDLDKTPDALAYFLYWSQPLNGPALATGVPIVTGKEARRRAFLDSAGAAYPRMANYSFDYGGAHWAVLDANAHSDLASPALRDWLARDLAAAHAADWRFVALHQPPFHSSGAHSDEQRPRLLVDVFEQGKVDLVIAGHVHNYQRSYPLKFVATAEKLDSRGRLEGRWTLDRHYDGKTRTTPAGIIYLVTGAGGARLYDSGRPADSSLKREYTARFVADVHSLTIVDVERAELTVRQISDQGDELDRFVVTRPNDPAQGAP